MTRLPLCTTGSDTLPTARSVQSTHAALLYFTILCAVLRQQWAKTSDPLAAAGAQLPQCRRVNPCKEIHLLAWVFGLCWIFQCFLVRSVPSFLLRNKMLWKDSAFEKRFENFLMSIFFLWYIKYLVRNQTLSAIILPNCEIIQHSSIAHFLCI